jgi:hypothetical protein
MKLIQNKVTQIALLLLLSLLVAVSLSGRILFSLPFFYEQTESQRWSTFLICTFILIILTLLSNKALILPYRNRLLQRKNLVFLLIMFIILTSTSFISTIHYWAVPKTHTIEICFDAEEGTKNLEIHKLMESVTKRLYDPHSFGTDYYPIIIKSGECVNGTITTLYWKFHLLLFSPALTAVVQENPPDGRFFLSINDEPAVVYFDKEATPPIENEVRFTDGLGKGEVLPFARNQSFFTGLKVLALVISAIYLSLFFFGLTETFITHNHRI